MITITIPRWLGRLLKPLMAGVIESTWRCGICGRDINGDTADAIRQHAAYFHDMHDIEIERG